MFPLLWQYKDEVKTMAQAFFGGVHPNDMKAATNEKAIEQLQAPAQVVIPMSMHFGAPCTPTVSKGDYVKLGQKIGEFKGLGAPIHASVSGTVAAVEPRPYSMGGKVMSVVIDNDFKDDLSEEVHAPADPDALSVEEMVEMVKQAGIVGMGGATFPTHVKISGGIGKVDTVIINGAECEPFITSDHRTMLEHTDLIVKGVALLKRYLESEEFIIGIEKNKPDAIEKLTNAFADDPAVTVKPLKSVYPQGAKQVLLYNAAGLVVGEGQRLASLGYIIINVTTLAKMAYYMETGMPLVDRCVTVDGSAVKEPKNLVVPVGTPISYLIENCGGLKEEPGKVLYGGPMMGKPAYSLEQPVLKATNAIIILNRKDSRSLEPTPCIHCGRCVENCPLGLNPTAYAAALEVEDENERFELLDKGKVQMCMECGCCSYVCPAHRPLVQNNRDAKRFVRKVKADRAEKK